MEIGWTTTTGFKRHEGRWEEVGMASFLGLSTLWSSSPPTLGSSPSSASSPSPFFFPSSLSWLTFFCFVSSFSMSFSSGLACFEMGLSKGLDKISSSSSSSMSSLSTGKGNVGVEGVGGGEGVGGVGGLGGLRGVGGVFGLTFFLFVASSPDSSSMASLVTLSLLDCSCGGKVVGGVDGWVRSHTSSSSLVVFLACMKKGNGMQREVAREIASKSSNIKQDSVIALRTLFRFF